MESAFGVEHGDEFAKFSMPTGLLKPMAGLASGAKSAGAGLKTGFKAGGNDFTPMKGLAQNKGFMGGAKAGNLASKKTVQAAGLGAVGGGTAMAMKPNKPQTR